MPALNEPLAGGPKRTLIVGTSYSDHLARELHEAGVFRDIYRLSYYRHASAATTDWHRVSTRRIIIFEQWEWSYFTVNITEFIEDAAANVPRFADALKQVDAEPVPAAPR